ncbi:MAG: AlkZ-related protein [Bacillota bacterium]
MEISLMQIQRLRAQLLPPGSVDSLESCLAAVERLGFLWAFTPAAGHLPALFTALATESEHQRWDWVWGWKDRLSAERMAYYGKVVAGKPTLVSREWLPLLYALTGNTGDLDDDLEQVQRSVRLVEVGVKVLRYLREHGPTGTRTLIARLTDGSKSGKQALDRALAQLDAAMLITKCGTEGGNSIANLWELFPRFWPEAVEAGTEIPTREAAVRLMRHLFVLTPAIQLRALEAIFPWNQGWQQKAIAHLQEAGDLIPCMVEGKPGLASRAAAAQF